MWVENDHGDIAYKCHTVAFQAGYFPSEYVAEI